MLLQDLEEKNLIHCPKWLIDNTHYLCIMGSTAYATNTNDSDFDKIYETGKIRISPERLEIFMQELTEEHNKRIYIYF